MLALTQTELNQLRTAILTSKRFKKWRTHIREQLKEIQIENYQQNNLQTLK
jgi:hypothetical protein